MKTHHREQELSFEDRMSMEGSLPPTNTTLEAMVHQAIHTPSQKSIQEAGMKIKELVGEGMIDPLQLAVAIKSATTLFEQVKDACVSDVLDALQKYSEKERVEQFGCAIDRAEVGTKYDFTICNDPAWNVLNEEMKGVKARMGEREKFLKALTHPMAIADESTGGELVTIVPPLKTSTSSYKITLRKD